VRKWYRRFAEADTRIPRFRWYLVSTKGGEMRIWQQSLIGVGLGVVLVPAVLSIAVRPTSQSLGTIRDP
jgi:hypothetical protein